MKLADLNTQQLKAVKTVKNPDLVFAGAGTGKNRVLNYQIWHLIKEKHNSHTVILDHTN